ncbi:MAG: hypothetical protein CVU19_01035 [Betaproteobacteria bacterium HGW-Betaproteobacteria-13]|nr:MAG: hypothetical protein CVU19_01035 [Betaproteobacteria bacterium HGW-Betaproteobacteria-13]
MLSAAFAYTHIQFNPPGLRYWLVFDLDFGGRDVSLDTARWYYEDVLAPPPNIIVINPKNGHAHYYYALMTPVVRGENARRRPQDFADAVYRGLGAMLDADPDYRGLIGRNPLHPAHISFTPCERPYELAELDEYVSDRRAGRAWLKAAREAGRDVNSRGRNCTIFDATRRWAYQWVDQYRHVNSGFDVFASACMRHAEALNVFPGHTNGALPFGEIKSIARSVSTWVWRHYSATQKGSDSFFSDLQSERGKKKGSAKRIELAPIAKRLSESGMSHRRVAEELGVDHKTIGNWLRRLDASGEKPIR